MSTLQVLVGSAVSDQKTIKNAKKSLRLIRLYPVPRVPNDFDPGIRADSMNRFKIFVPEIARTRPADK